MSSKVLRYRCICPYCKKAFDMRQEGFREEVTGLYICADCNSKSKFKTIDDYAKDKA